MDIAAQKLLAIVVIWLIGLVAGLWPVLIGARTPHDRFFSLGNALAGGVFLGAGLIHLLPDAIDSYRAVLGPDLDYPLASLVCAAGFLLVLLIEKVLLRGDEAQLAEAAQRQRIGVHALRLGPGAVHPLGDRRRGARRRKLRGHHHRAVHRHCRA